jgi:hypothetical protein
MIKLICIKKIVDKNVIKFVTDKNKRHYYTFCEIIEKIDTLLTNLYVSHKKNNQNNMMNLLPAELMSYIHEYIDYKEVHKRKFKIVLNDMVFRSNKLPCDISTLTEFIVVILSLIMTALMPIYYILMMSRVRLNYYLYIFIVKCVFGFAIDYILVTNVINYYDSINTIV